MTDKIVVLSTCASEAEAERLARLLVERAAGGLRQHRAGRAQLLPVERRGGMRPRNACC